MIIFVYLYFNNTKKYKIMKPSKNGNIQISVQCHPETAYEIRLFAKLVTGKQKKKEELLKEKTK